MKKILCLLLAIVMAASMTACSGNGGTQETTTQLIFSYPTKESMDTALKVQTELRGITLPAAEERVLSQMAFYTYSFEEKIKLIVKIDSSSQTVMNIEIDTPKTISDEQKALLDKLMSIVATCVEPRETEEGIKAIVNEWMNVETGSDGYGSSIGIIYTKTTIGDEDMYAYYAKL